jgi:hypothetical protein
MRIVKPHKVAWVLSHGYAATQGGGYRCLVCGCVYRYLTFMRRHMEIHSIGDKA